MITPHQLDLWSSNMSHLYNALEGEIIRIMIKRLKSGNHDNILDWQVDKLKDLHLFNQEVVRELAKVTPLAEKEIERMFEETGEQLVKDVDGALPQEPLPMPNNLDTVMRGYFNQTWSQIDNYVNQTLVTTNYGLGSAQIAYQEVLNQTTAYVTTGINTFEQGVERAVRDMAQKGIRTQLTDQGGNTWSLERYVRTVIKSTLGNTYDEVRKERMSEYGVYTVVVSSHVGAREACSLIQGQVVDLRYPHELPPDWPYKSVYDPSWQAAYKTPGGHMGVNCGHYHIVFVPGVNTNNQQQFDQKLNKRVADATTRQRQLEREIVKHKKSLMVAEELDSDNVGRYKQLISGRQQAMREHLAENNDYLSRNYKREQVYTPLDSLVRDFSYKG